MFLVNITWFKPDIPNSLVNIPIFLEQSNRVSTNKSRGGRSCLYIGKNLACTPFLDVNIYKSQIDLG